MPKFQTQIDDLKNRFQTAQRVLVVLPTQVNVDKLASGLALYLSLRAAGKQSSIVSEAPTLVAHGNLYGVGEVKNVLPTGNGNFIISLDGVVDNTGQMPTVPALEKLDWYPSGQTLNLVFHVVPGQRFEPTNMRSSYENGGFDLIVAIGASNLGELGGFYIQNVALFGQAPIINIDLNPANGNFGAVNIIGQTSATVSEIVGEVISGSGLPMDADIASDILTGIYDATNNLTGIVDPETFLAASKALQAGGRIPNQPPSASLASSGSSAVSSQPSATQTQVPVIEQPVAQAQPVAQSQPDTSAQNSLSQNPFLAQVDQSTITTNPLPVSTDLSQPVSSQPMAQPFSPAIPQSDGGLDLRQVLQIPTVQEQQSSVVNSQSSENSNQPPAESQPDSQSVPQQSSPTSNVSSPEEKPVGEYVQNQSPEMDSTPTPDWLVPKIFKSGNLG